MTVSYWRRTGHLGTFDCDAVVIGGGICGISAALALQRAGNRTVVLERHTLASGASGRNAGFLMRGTAENYAAAVRDYGRDGARVAWRWTEENLAMLRAEGIEHLPAYRRVPSCLLALDEAEAEALHESDRLLREDGFDSALISAGTDRVWSGAGEFRPRIGLVNPHDASCSPVEIVKLLAGKFTGAGGIILETQEVTALPRAADIAGDGVLTVQSEGATLRCGRVVICTNAYIGSLDPAFSALITPRRGQMLAIRAPGLTLAHSYYANYGYEYFRQTADGAIVVGGCRKAHAQTEVGTDDVTTPHVQGDLERFARAMFGLRTGDYEVAARWSGVMAFSPDGLPIIGPLDAARRVWFVSACTGHGMGMAHKAAAEAVRAMLAGSEAPYPLRRFSAAVV